ncbi:signal transduction histidine kinase [Actinoplanes octamycinicus]|uniref:histidine kinase n=1 Tax=Actinoplanes octamycinicus TaxID=135948 RepID=A0A7W7H465_9ACTN|nr:ATP-binding protein [Actinoplanes octamycinicus]MBB4743504.1 signal transduction histidine kinase [Actinoplanes octamycinicus]GIE62510.1 two-component sensor histidine kinase [Actinoplanes octamycinicus]
MGVRLRFTLLYGVLFLISGAGLLAITAAFSVSRTTHVAPPGTGQPPAEQIARLQEELASASAAHTRQLLAGALVGLAVMLLISLVLGRAAAGRVLRPLRRITAATRRITADNLHSRLAVAGPADEVKALADTIDDLLGRLEESFAAQRRFVADASHELRTPLATVRAAIDVAEAKPAPPAEVVRLAGRVRTELDQLERLLEGLLVLARAQHGALDGRTPLAVRSLIPAGVPVEGADFVTVGNPVLLARMVSNVVDNARRHNDPGGWMRVTLRDGTLVVENDGPVLDPGQVATLGQPFRRLGADRTGSGTGLGLAIASAVASAHGGSLGLRARPGGGLRVEIRLP